MIWDQELHHERFVRVTLASHEAHPTYFRQPTPWVQSDVTEDYQIISEWPAINKTFHINSESRSYASRFYRVQLPCRYVRGDRVEEKGIFYFNPELDTLEIKGMQYFINFADELWRNDPRKAGLLRVVIDITLTASRFSSLYAEVENKAPIREVLSRLKYVTFMDQGDRGRMYLHRFHPGGKFEFHRSRPIMAVASSFQRLPDPRPIQADLKRLHIGMSEPRRFIHSWFRMMAAVGVQTDFEYRFMITYGGARAQIYSRDDAVRYIHEEDSKWRDITERRWDKSQTPGSLATVPGESDQELDQAPQPAIGFWLFPLEFLGPLPPVGPDPSVSFQGPWVYNRMDSTGSRSSGFCRNVDVSEYTPELCLFDLPNCGALDPKTFMNTPRYS